MKIIAALFTSLFIFSAAVAAPPAINAAASTYTFSSLQDAERFSTLTNETRCVVCQFQNIADSNAPLAGSLRDKIYQLIQEKKSDAEIKNYLVKRYGEVILLKPRFHPLTAVLWSFPVLALAVFAWIMTRFYRRNASI
jgi:cytochrome c-type biogenesis protein CcmH